MGGTRCGRQSRRVTRTRERNISRPAVESKYSDIRSLRIGGFDVRPRIYARNTCEPRHSDTGLGVLAVVFILIAGIGVMTTMVLSAWFVDKY